MWWGGRVLLSQEHVRLRIPTTAAARGDRIHLPTARFDVEPTPRTEYDAVAVRGVRPLPARRARGSASGHGEARPDAREGRHPGCRPLPVLLP